MLLEYLLPPMEILKGDYFRKWLLLLEIGKELEVVILFHRKDQLTLVDVSR